MNNIILAIIELLGGMGAFLLGFKVLSESIEKLASAGLKRLFNKTSKNRFIGVGIGALVTAIIQSSSSYHNDYGSQYRNYDYSPNCGFTKF